MVHGDCTFLLHGVHPMDESVILDDKNCRISGGKLGNNESHHSGCLGCGHEIQTSYIHGNLKGPPQCHLKPTKK